jgi:hypothetical protein
MALLVALATVLTGGSAHIARAKAGQCTPAETRNAVARFVVAWNKGDLSSLDRLIAPEPVFKWLSSGAPGDRRAAAFDRSSLRRYFALRHARHDQIQLRSFRFNGSDVREDGSYGHFEYTLRRSAADYRAGETFDAVGKGAVNCSLRPTAIAVWSMSGPTAVP